MAKAMAASAAAAAAESVISYFEVHVQRDDRWTIDGTAENVADALADAEDLARKLDVTAVKVISERYNPATDQSATRIVWQTAKQRRQSRGETFGTARRPPAQRAAAPAPAPATPLSTNSVAPPPTVPSDEPAVAAPSVARPLADPADGQSTPVWRLFAWASIALAVAATLLFVVLLLIT